MRARGIAYILGLALLAVPLGGAAAAGADGIPVYAETPADALARNVRILADSPRSFDALLGAGKAALQLGDEQAAAGFFGRAAEIKPNSPFAQAGMGAALVGTGDASQALVYFTRAQQLGASAVAIACDRGLAYDLLGNHAAAQADYRIALNGTDRDEARRRLALSLAISGDKATALSTLEPLLARRDAAAVRVRALVLALGGELAGAKMVLDYTMPGTSAQMDPFLRRLPTLTTTQKAAAVHLGVFPDASGVAVASGSPASQGDRLASIEALLGQSEQAAAAPSPAYQAAPQAPAYQPAPQAPAYRPLPAPTAVPFQQPVRTALVSPQPVQQARSASEAIEIERVAASSGGRKIWLQLASGANPAALPQEFNKLRSRDPSLFDGIEPYVATSAERSRLLIGPFQSRNDARLFADALESARISAFSWTSEPGQVVRKLSSQ